MIVNTLWASVVILLLLQSAPHHGLRQSWRKTSAVLPAAACVSSLAATGVDYAAQHRQYSSHLHAVIYRRHSYSHAARTSSTRRQAVSSSGVIDNAKIDQDLLFNFEKRMDEVVQLASSPQLNIDAMKDWDERIRSLSVELRRLPNKSILLQLYESVIAKFAALELDSLQINSYEMLTSAIINALFALLPRNAPMTDLIDDLTDANLAFVETFRTVIEQAYAKVSPSDR